MGATVSDELLEWPPDVFALTDVILERSEAYRSALSPPGGMSWPPDHNPEWPDAVTEASAHWSTWVEEGRAIGAQARLASVREDLHRDVPAPAFR